jgi:hypothetical protein
MALKALLIIVVISILMEDGSSIRKTAEERKEDEEVQKAVNATLAAEEEEKQKEEKKKRKKTVEDPVQIREDEASPDQVCPEVPLCPDPVKCPEEKTCPEVKSCPPCEICPEIRPCQPCRKCPDPVECGPCHECPPIECGPCPPIHCQPCPVVNHTSGHQDCPSPPLCPEAPGLSLPAAMAVGAVTGILVTGTAAIVGFILRYVPPFVSGFLFLATIIILWYLCSQYPETARELGGRAATLLREAATALSHRVMEALRHHHEQVGVFILNLISSKFEFHVFFFFFKLCTKIFYVRIFNFN